MNEKKKVVVLGVGSIEKQVVIRALLSKQRVKFVDSTNGAIEHCHDASIIALGTNHESSVPKFFEKGFKGEILPILVDKKQGMMVKGKLVLAVQPRELPGFVIGMLKELERIELERTVA